METKVASSIVYYSKNENKKDENGPLLCLPVNENLHNDSKYDYFLLLKQMISDLCCYS